MAPVDLSDARSFAKGFPQSFFRRLRREAPVWWHEPTRHTPGAVGFWVVSRYADVVTVLKEPEVFSSEVGGTQIFDGKGHGYQLNQTDDPKHRRLRALVNTGFLPGMIGRLEDQLREQMRSILSEIDIGQPFDFVSAIARELPLQAICMVLGVPMEDREELGEIVDLAIGAGTGEALAIEHLKRLGAYADRIVEQKRNEPTDDILSVIVHARSEDGGPQLDNRELRAFFALLFPAGAETTRSAIAGGLVALVHYPDQLRQLRADQSLMKGAVEEIVRWTSPSVYKRRTATRNVALSGTAIRRGDKVTVWEMSANRDEGEFSSPYRFDVRRKSNFHLGFGLGTHFCLGANLARLEIRVALEELMARYESFEVVGDFEWTNNNRLVGLTRVPLKVRLKPGPS